MRSSLRHLRFVVISAVLLAGVGAAVYWFSLDQITFNINGKLYTLRLRGGTVAEAIKSSDILVESADVVEPALNTPLSDNMTIRISKAEQVAIEIDGEIRRIYTHSTAPLTILSEAKIQIGEHDIVLVDGIRLTEYTITERPPRILRVVQAITVTVDDAGTPISVTTTAQTVGLALQEAELSLYAADEVMPALDAPLEQGMTIQVVRSQPVTILMDGHEIKTRTTGKTVEEVLAKLQITISGLDYAIPHESAPFENTIRIVRVSENFEFFDEILAYNTIMQPDEDLPLDTRTVVQVGKNGLFRTRYRIRVEDGQEISRKLQDSWVETEPVNEIIAYGTKIVSSTRSTEAGEIEYWRIVPMQVSTYRSNQHGKVAVDEAIIPLGTQVYIEGYGKAIVAERLPEGSGLTIALGYTDNQTRAWNGTVEVYLLTPVPQEIPYLLPLETSP